MRGLLFTPPYEHYFIDDRRAYPFYLKALEFNIPLYVHQALQWSPPADFTPVEFAKISQIDHVTIDFPNLPINIEHMAFPWTQELLAIMAHAPNVYTDISDLFRRPTILAWNLVMAKEYGVISRVMYGTDFVGLNTSQYFEQIIKETNWLKYELNKILKKSGWQTLSEEDINGILINNALKFFNL